MCVIIFGIYECRVALVSLCFFFSSRRRHTRLQGDWSSDVCSSDLVPEVVLFLLAVWLLVFFRDPSRSGPRGEQYVIAPADGKIVDVQVVDEPMYLKTRATRISIFMSVFDVHVNRYPATGTVELVRYNPGRFLPAASDKASLENEQASVGLRGARGPLLVRQIAGLIARRIEIGRASCRERV